MVTTNFAQVQRLIDEMVEKSKGLRPPPLRFYQYLKRCLDDDLAGNLPQFPLDIKIAPENKYLLKGEYDPKQVIHLEEPVKMPDGTPMWFNASSSEIFLRFGYENLDARKISKVKMNMEYIRATCSAISSLCEMRR